jgi:hypothetical protein
MFDAHDDLETLPPSLATALRRDVRPAGGRDAAVAAIMEAVRQEPVPRTRTRFLGLRPKRPRWALRRGALSPAGAMLAACLTMAVGWLGTLGGPRPVAVGARPERDLSSGTVRASAFRDSILDNAIVLAIRDTVRMVRFALEAPAASRVALVAANGRSVPMHRTSGGWIAEVALRPGRHQVGFVVDDSQFVGRRHARSVPSFTVDTLTLAAAADTI